MKSATRQFLKLLLEEENSDEKPRTREVYSVQTTNALSRGRPLSDPGLSNMKYRSEASPEEATEMLKELGVTGGGGSDWIEATVSILNSARSGPMKVLLAGASAVQSAKGKDGVRLRLAGIWKDDDKGGKRSFGMVRALLVAAQNTGIIPAVKNLRVEEVVGENALLFYSGSRAKSWTPAPKKIKNEEK